MPRNVEKKLPLFERRKLAEIERAAEIAARKPKYGLVRRYCNEKLLRGNFGSDDEIVALAAQIQQQEMDLAQLYSERMRLCSLERDPRNGRDDTACFIINDVDAFAASEEREKNLKKEIKHLESQFEKIESIVEQAVIELPRLVICPTIAGLIDLKYKAQNQAIKQERHLSATVEKLISRPRAKLDDVLKSQEIVDLKARTEDDIKQLQSKIAIIDKYIDLLADVM